MAFINKPVRVYIGGEELIGYTNLKLTRSREKMTGSLSITIFMSYLPTGVVMGTAEQGQEVLVYLGGHLAFTGTIDRRKDESGSSGKTGEAEGGGSGPSLNIGPDQYTLTLTCRGSTKFLIDSSHQHPTGTMIKPTSKSAFEELVEPWGIELDWDADVVDMDRLRLRRGARVIDELARVGEMMSLYIHENRDGSLRVTDKPAERTGEAIILGRNILNFSTNQLGDTERSEIKVEGQLTEKGTWGESAIIPTFKRSANESVPGFIPVGVLTFGNATQANITRRTDYEANKRAAFAKQISLDVFHVLQTNGEPWDIGVKHYVDIPPAGIHGQFEVTNLTYTVDASKTIKTSLTLAPAPVKSKNTNSGEPFAALDNDAGGVKPNSDGKSNADGTTNTGKTWDGPKLSNKAAPAPKQGGALDRAAGTGTAGKPKMTIPEDFGP